MHAFDDLNREFFEIEIFTAADGDELRLVHAASQRNIRRRPRADDFGTEFLGDERNVGDMIRVAVSGENIIGALDHFQHRRFIGFPFGAGIRLSASKKRIDENDRLADLNLPTRVA